MGKSTKIVKEGKTYKAKAVKEVELDAKVESDEVDNLEERVSKLKEDLDTNLASLYQDMMNMRDKLNRLLSRNGLEKL